MLIAFSAAASGLRRFGLAWFEPEGIGLFVQHLVVDGVQHAVDVDIAAVRRGQVPRIKIFRFRPPSGPKPRVEYLCQLPRLRGQQQNRLPRWRFAHQVLGGDFFARGQKHIAHGIEMPRLGRQVQSRLPP